MRYSRAFTPPRCGGGLLCTIHERGTAWIDELTDHHPALYALDLGDPGYGVGNMSLYRLGGRRAWFILQFPENRLALRWWRGRGAWPWSVANAY